MKRRLQAAGLFLCLAAIAELATLYRVHVLSQSFAQRADVHLGREVARMRADVGHHEDELGGMTRHVAGALDANPNISREQLFETLHNEVH
ncbi:MAG TPA: hypothetical protein VG323_02095, partial [Thermoanaerobaculia bacterium]|nr:hypothetical protein [Thermoanaerobaculia bacterium]